MIREAPRSASTFSSRDFPFYRAASRYGKTFDHAISVYSCKDRAATACTDFYQNIHSLFERTRIITRCRTSIRDWHAARITWIKRLIPSTPRTRDSITKGFRACLEACTYSSRTKRFFFEADSLSTCSACLRLRPHRPRSSSAQHNRKNKISRMPSVRLMLARCILVSWSLTFLLARVASCIRSKRKPGFVAASRENSDRVPWVLSASRQTPPRLRLPLENHVFQERETRVALVLLVSFKQAV